MAFRRFQNEPTYAAPDIQKPRYTMLALQRLANSNRQQKFIKGQAQAKRNNEAFDPDVDVSSYETDEQTNQSILRDIANRITKDRVSGNYMPSNYNGIVGELKNRVALAKIQKENEKQLLTTINQSDDPYLDKDKAKSMVMDSTHAVNANPKNRSSRMKEAEKNIMENGVAFNQSKYITDFIDEQSSQTFEMLNSYENELGVTSTNKSTIKAPFMRPTGNKITTANGQVIDELEPGVTVEHIRSYLNKHPSKWGHKYYEGKVEEKLLADVASKRASGDLEKEFADLTDQEIVDTIKETMPAEFEFQKMNIARKDLEDRNNTEVRLQKILRRDNSASSRKAAEDSKTMDTIKRVASNALRNDIKSIALIKEANPNITSLTKGENGKFTVVFKDSRRKEISGLAGMISLVPKEVMKHFDVEDFNDIHVPVTVPPIAGYPDPKRKPKEKEVEKPRKLDANYGGAFD